VVNILDEELIEPCLAFYPIDRGYIDFKRLHAFTRESASLVVRTKENVLLQRRYFASGSRVPIRKAKRSLSRRYFAIGSVSCR
jgi:hypothetical protein